LSILDCSIDVFSKSALAGVDILEYLLGRSLFIFILELELAVCRLFVDVLDAEVHQRNELVLVDLAAVYLVLDGYHGGEWQGWLAGLRLFDLEVDDLLDILLELNEGCGLVRLLLLRYQARCLLVSWSGPQVAWLQIFISALLWSCSWGCKLRMFFHWFCVEVGQTILAFILVNCLTSFNRPYPFILTRVDGMVPDSQWVAWHAWFNLILAGRPLSLVFIPASWKPCQVGLLLALGLVLLELFNALLLKDPVGILY
jgi:hypothetical protein